MYRCAKPDTHANKPQHLLASTPNITDHLFCILQLQQVKPYAIYMKDIVTDADEHLLRSYLTPNLPLGRAYQFPPGWSSTMCQEDITAGPYPLCDSVIPSALQQCLQNSDSLHVHVATLHWGRVICQVFCAFI